MSRIITGVALLLTLAGCGGGGLDDTPDLGTVTGKVTLDGSPLADATLTFSPSEGGRSAGAETDSGGNYELMYSLTHAGATPGEYDVSISTESTKSDADGNDVTIPEKLPAKYNDNSELKKTVTAGSNEINFALDSKGEISKEEEEKEDDGC